MILVLCRSTDAPMMVIEGDPQKFLQGGSDV
jgi:hypothetical protein